MKNLILLAISMFLIIEGYGQCETWNDSPRKEDAENAHVVYRQYVKTKDFATAFEHWQTAFEIAPAADGRRDSHFKDGIAIYRDKFKNATDDAQKEEYKVKILSLYDQGAECIGNGTIRYKNCNDQACFDKQKGFFLGDKAYDMYYNLRVPREQTLEVLKQSVDLAGMNSEYIVLKPYADIIVYQYLTEQIDKKEARDAYKLLNEIADYNIENNARLSDYYKQTKASMNGEFAKIENYIFDCAYFKGKYKPEYEADPENIELVTEIIKVLKRQGCEESDPFLSSLEAQYEVYAEEFNRQQQEEFERKNPQVVAKRLYDEGDYQGAVDKYQEAINLETDKEKLAQYYFAMASIQGRRLDRYSTARANAIKAAEMKENWGRPYMLIGDLYAESSRSCGSDAYERGKAIIAAIDKWAYAKSIDPEVQAEANRNIAKFSQFLPPKEEAFMRGEKAGQAVKVGCWIGESVKLRFN